MNISRISLKGWACVLVVSLLLVFPAVSAAQEVDPALFALVRAELASSPGAQGLSEEELDELALQVAREAEEQGITADHILNPPGTTFAEDEGVRESTEESVASYGPLASLAVLLLLLAIAIAVWRRMAGKKEEAVATEQSSSMSQTSQAEAPPSGGPHTPNV